MTTVQNLRSCHFLYLNFYMVPLLLQFNINFLFEKLLTFDVQLQKSFENNLQMPAILNANQNYMWRKVLATTLSLLFSYLIKVLINYSQLFKCYLTGESLKLNCSHFSSARVVVANARFTKNKSSLSFCGPRWEKTKQEVCRVVKESRKVDEKNEDYLV